MSHPVIEIAAAVTVAAALALGAMFVLPRQKPEPPAEEQRPPLEDPAFAVAPKPVIQAEPLPEKTDAERVVELERKAEKVQLEQLELIKQVQSLTEAERKK
jgi:hypothetical protein